ncbi:MAG: hypothetical protein MZV70_70080 [Desulfobacterales bacterium]|nr:hypothetical protein [Desulfobacterales bacterium]
MTLLIATTAMAGTITGAAATLQQETVTYPVLNVRFNDNITARASHINDAFTARTIEPVTINNQLFPVGSTVNGRVVEVIRPSGNDPGALKVAFTDISGNGQTSALPAQVLTAQVEQTGGPGIVTRLAEFPFVWPGRSLGTVGRTLGGMTIIAGNSTEQILNGLGIAAGELTQRQWAAAGRSAIGSAIALGRASFRNYKNSSKRRYRNLKCYL